MEDTQIRDQLALERTHLANERTVLAYLRTALAFVAAGAAILHFYPDRPLLVTGAAALIGSGALIGIWGARRFFTVRKQLNS
ncbi:MULTISPECIES: DUF202 domain-containing protein [Spongiibacter]|uniref:DUF202 domain-containing protein n=1 Tax=Spongiibacter TaxID=630749 RepID=UPI0003B33DC4|nr:MULTISPECIES: DUF202 domain-containing protein [Spongiibacter]MAY38877.1 DUF202 domain-containing protein [Spongiibacter sp.]MBI57007.1 DUF202 domain-containing protein [Spongiibacter sp.]|tara:strand:- start:385 stop:630 length:246 start_codon:yes stop_codon:yes gene_type:complete